MASKGKGKPKPAPHSISDMPRRTSEHRSVEVRKISNGYVVRHTADTGKGYESTERYHPSKPKVSIAVQSKRGK